ncbi:MAG: hypothetical protein KDA47_04165 [Planctomycetales bacterium]|nr:hypothetical protein [Planctomycetales bacterium]
MPPAVIIPLIGLLWCGGVALLVMRRGAVRETTLVAGWWWSVATLTFLAIVLVVFHAGWVRPAWREPLRFVAAVGLFCPLMSLLGAKRPQDRAWNFIVLSLWIVLAMPAAEAAFLQRGQPLEIRGARAWFLWALIGLGLVNLLPTRFWLSSLLLAFGHILLLARYLPLIERPWFMAADVAGFAAVIAALGWAAFNRRRRPECGLDRVWLDFRDSFGTLWGLRVVQRVNAVAQASEWPVLLHWFGFHDLEADAFDKLPPEARRALDQTLRNLLRRFVSDEWIAARLSRPVD